MSKHDEIRQAILDGRPGCAQVTVGLNTMSLENVNGVLEFFGNFENIPPHSISTPNDVKDAVIDALPDGGSIASRHGIISRADILRRADHIDHSELWPSAQAK